MTNDTRSPEEIEREIEVERSQLSSNLEDLQDKFSIDTVVRQIGDQFREHGGDMGRSISEQVKANPIPLALTGIGLAWLMFGSGQRSAPHRGASIYGSDSRYDGYRSAEREYHRSRANEGRSYTPPTAHISKVRSGPSWSHDDDDGPSMTERLSTGAETARDRVSDGVTTAKGGVASAAGSVSDAASNAAGRVSDGASAAASRVSDAAASARSSLASGAQSVQSGIASAGSRIAEGTEALTEEGRARVIAARRKALQMRDQAARSLHQGTDAMADFYDRQPLVAGALALAVGAALGGALPRTRTEDALMGAQSDALFDEAERIFEEEKAKAVSVARSVQDEVKDVASEAKADLDRGAPGDKTAAQAVGDKAKSVAERIADKARQTADDENLGKPKT